MALETIETINTRQSIRHYNDKQITKEELDTILHAGQRAPIGMSKYKEMHITVIQNKDFLDELDRQAEIYFKQKNKTLFHGALTGIIISGKPTNYYGMEYDNGACVLENMHLAATDLGIGAVYLKGIVEFFDNNKDFLEKLNLPEGFIPLAGMAFGYPKEDLVLKPKEHKIEIDYI